MSVLHAPYGSPEHPAAVLVAVCILLLLSGAIVAIDVDRRSIPTGLCAAVALAALLYWFGVAGTRGAVIVGAQIGMAAALAVPLLVLFAFRWIEGSSVKLMLAVVLWVDTEKVAYLLLAVVTASGSIALFLKLLNLVFWRVKADRVPYGVSIMTGTLITLMSYAIHFTGST